MHDKLTEAIKSAIVHVLNGNNVDPTQLRIIFRDSYVANAIIKGLIDGVEEYNASLDEIEFESLEDDENSLESYEG